MERDIVKLDYPMAIGEAKKQEYRLSGILLKGRGPKGLTKLEAPYPLGVSDFASLSRENLINLVSHLQNTKYEKTLDMAERAQVLADQAKIDQTDGFLSPTKERPFTWGLRESLPEEIEGQLRILKEFGISRVETGLEIEFSVPEKPVTGFNGWVKTKKTILSGLRWELSKEKGPIKQKKLAEKIEQVKTFNAREILMYELIEMDPRTRDILEPLFGAHSDGGYYDGINCLELKLKPCSPQKMLENRRIVLSALFEKTFKYGLEIVGLPSIHLNISFWDKDGNLFSDKHPRFKSKTKRLVEGIAKGFYDGIFTVINKYDVDSNRLMKVGVDINRQNILRYSKERLEVRPSSRDIKQDPDMLLAVFLAGAIYGLKKPETPDVKRAKKVVSPVVHHKRFKSETIAQVLGNSSIKKDGHLDLSREYIREHQARIEYELGLGEKPTAQSLNPIFKLLMHSEYEDIVLEFFNRIKVQKDEKGNLTLRFPGLSNGKYQFYIKPVNMHLIPPEMRKRIIEGEKIPNDELSRYIRPGSHIPKPGRFGSIDISKLSANLEIAGTVTKYSVNDYDLNKGRNKHKPRNFSKQAWSRYQRLFYSRGLSSLGKDFKKDFKKAARKFARQESYKPEPVLTRKSVAAMFFNKIKDKEYVLEIAPKNYEKSWLGKDRIEGKDYLKEAFELKFDWVRHPAVFEVFIRRLFYGINKNYVRKHKFVIHNRPKSGGYGEIVIEVSPRFMKHLKKLSQKSSKK